MDDESFLKQFEDCSWPLDKWHHRQHIKVAFLYLRRHPFDEAMTRMRAAINTYNAANKIPEEPTRGYHETMTRAWMRLVELALAAYGPGENAEDFYSQNPQLSQKQTLRLFYSRERLMSPEAKKFFLEPDLTAFPKLKSLS
jgi:hypothetical protein